MPYLIRSTALGASDWEIEGTINVLENDGRMSLEEVRCCLFAEEEMFCVLKHAAAAAAAAGRSRG